MSFLLRRRNLSLKNRILLDRFLFRIYLEAMGSVEYFFKRKKKLRFLLMRVITPALSMN